MKNLNKFFLLVLFIAFAACKKDDCGCEYPLKDFTFTFTNQLVIQDLATAKQVKLSYLNSKGEKTYVGIKPFQPSNNMNFHFGTSQVYQVVKEMGTNKIDYLCEFNDKVVGKFSITTTTSGTANVTELVYDNSIVTPNLDNIFTINVKSPIK